MTNNNTYDKKRISLEDEIDNRAKKIIKYYEDNSIYERNSKKDDNTNNKDKNYKKKII